MSATPPGWNSVNFTPESWRKLKEAYTKALEEEQESFVFEGNEYLTAFAKYFIEFHDHQFKGT